MRTPGNLEVGDVAEGLEDGDDMYILNVRGQVLDADSAAATWSLDDECPGWIQRSSLVILETFFIPKWFPHIVIRARDSIAF